MARPAGDVLRQNVVTIPDRLEHCQKDRSSSVPLSLISPHVVRITKSQEIMNMRNIAGVFALAHWQAEMTGGNPAWGYLRAFAEELYHVDGGLALAAHRAADRPIADIVRSDWIAVWANLGLWLAIYAPIQVLLPQQAVTRNAQGDTVQFAAMMGGIAAALAGLDRAAGCRRSTPQPAGARPHRGCWPGAENGRSAGPAASARRTARQP